MMKKIEYNELASARIQEQRDLVISECLKSGKDSGFTISQRVEIVEGKHTTKVFLKNAIHVASVDELYNLRDAINEAIQKTEEKNKK